MNNYSEYEDGSDSESNYNDMLEAKLFNLENEVFRLKEEKGEVKKSYSSNKNADNKNIELLIERDNLIGEVESEKRKVGELLALLETEKKQNDELKSKIDFLVDNMEDFVEEQVNSKIETQYKKQKELESQIMDEIAIYEEKNRILEEKNESLEKKVKSITESYSNQLECFRESFSKVNIKENMSEHHEEEIQDMKKNFEEKINELIEKNQNLIDLKEDTIIALSSKIENLTKEIEKLKKTENNFVEKQNDIISKNNLLENALAKKDKDIIELQKNFEEIIKKVSEQTKSERISLIQEELMETSQMVSSQILGNACLQNELTPFFEIEKVDVETQTKENSETVQKLTKKFEIEKEQLKDKIQQTEKQVIEKENLLKNKINQLEKEIIDKEILLKEKKSQERFSTYNVFLQKNDILQCTCSKKIEENNKNREVKTSQKEEIEIKKIENENSTYYKKKYQNYRKMHRKLLEEKIALLEKEEKYLKTIKNIENKKKVELPLMYKKTLVKLH